MNTYTRLLSLAPLIVLASACGAHTASASSHHRASPSVAAAHAHSRSSASHSNHKPTIAKSTAPNSTGPNTGAAHSTKPITLPVISKPPTAQGSASQNTVLVIAPPSSAPAGEPSAMTVSFDQNSHLVQSANITAKSFNTSTDTVSFTPPRGLRAGTYTVIVLFEYGNGKFFASAPESYVNK